MTVLVIHFERQLCACARTVLLLAAWTLMDAVLSKFLPLWVSARGTEFSWANAQMGIDANIRMISFIAMAGLVWVSMISRRSTPFAGLGLAVVLATPGIKECVAIHVQSLVCVVWLLFCFVFLFVADVWVFTLTVCVVAARYVITVLGLGAWVGLGVQFGLALLSALVARIAYSVVTQPRRKAQA